MHSLVYTIQGSSSKSLLICEVISVSTIVSLVFDKQQIRNDSKVGFGLENNLY